MFLNENIVHLCLECNFAFSQREYEKLKFKSFIFSFGKTNVKCSNCKTKDNFIHVSTSWANILYTLNKKGYVVMDCSEFNSRDDFKYTYIRFKVDIKRQFKPSFMVYDSQWHYTGSSIIKDREDQKTLIYVYKNEYDYYLEHKQLTKKLKNWANLLT